MRIFSTLCFVLISIAAFSQTQMVMSGNIGLKFANGIAGTPIYLVLDNPADDALVATPGSAIWSENEYHIVKWNVGTSTGVYVVPFMSPSAAYVAPEVTINTAGAGSGTIEFSTYRHNNLLATTPSDVTHLNYDLTGLASSGVDAIDRFWIIDALNYTTKPSVDVAFTYDPAELEVTMTGNQLLIQRFNPSTFSWIDYYIPTTSSIAPDIALANSAIPVGDFYRSWTLTNVNNPLPIELLNFKSECMSREGVELTWTTASEINNSHFTVERSEEGIIWEVIADNIHGAGNSTEENSYSYIDNNPSRGLNYYRLSQTDFDGTSEEFEPIVSDCDGVGFEIVNAFSTADQNNMQLVVSAGRDEAFNIEIIDMNGRTAIAQQNVMLIEGLNYFNIDKSSLGYGMYLIRLQSENELMTRKILLN